jgi:hypothetical protein
VTCLKRVKFKMQHRCYVNGCKVCDYAVTRQKMFNETVIMHEMREKIRKLICVKSLIRIDIIVTIY